MRHPTTTLCAAATLLATAAFGTSCRVANPEQTQRSASPGDQATAATKVTGNPTSFARLVRSAAPAVVSIAVEQTAPQEQNPLLRDPFFRQFFDDPETSSATRIASGSGVIVDGRRGLILTNHHVVDDARVIEVLLPDGRRFRARRLGSDEASDIALLHMRASNLPQIALGNSDLVEVGDPVLAIGNPFGLGQSVTSGIVSALGRGLSQTGYESYIQTDAPINPGNSGGPLIGIDGTVIGINSALFGPGANIGIGFAVPSSTAQFVMDQVLKHGVVRRGRIGVAFLNPLASASARLPVVGARIASVTPGSAATRAGLREGDVIVAVAGRPTRTPVEVRNLVGRTEIGAKLPLKIQRGAQTLDLPVEVEAP